MVAESFRRSNTGDDFQGMWINQEIKTAYRKLAVKHHPDKGGDTEKFKEITRAYEVFASDKSSNHLYFYTARNMAHRSWLRPEEIAMHVCRWRAVVGSVTWNATKLHAS